MGPYALSFDQVDGTRLPDVGGKGANLGELTRAGFPVPPGFCVTTAAYRDLVRTSGELDALLDALDRATHEDLGTIAALGGRVREHLGRWRYPPASGRPCSGRGGSLARSTPTRFAPAPRPGTTPPPRSLGSSTPFAGRP